MINLVVISNFCVVFLLKIRHETSNLSLAHFFWKCIVIIHNYVHVTTFAKQQKYNILFREGKYCNSILYQQSVLYKCYIPVRL